MMIEEGTFVEMRGDFGGLGLISGNYSSIAPTKSNLGSIVEWESEPPIGELELLIQNAGLIIAINSQKLLQIPQLLFRLRVRATWRMYLWISSVCP
jgi:hypothetical protein